MRTRPPILVITVVALLALTACDDRSPDQLLQDALRAHREGRIGDALGMYREVLAEQPRNEYAWYNLGLIHQTRGQDDVAETEYRRALEIDPAFVQALFNLGVLLGARGDTDGAIAQYREVIRVQPEHAAAHLNLGFALLETGDLEAGQAALERAVELDPALASRIPEGTLASPGPPADDGKAPASP
ncbi:MAG TPA: tetratricopeptide repeat protein [Actinomycetota bacterium]|nr:tetratricopeptide repeat protein [Actinomycetota bacterium]